VNNTPDKGAERARTKPSPEYRKDYAEFLELAAHELDSPLRKLTVQVEKMATKYDAGQTAEAQQAFNKVQLGLQQMRTLVDELYELGQLDTAEFNPATCDTVALVRQAAGELTAAARDKHPEITIGELPAVYGDPVQLRQLFSELLKNAIRFSGGDIRVEITASELSTADNTFYDLAAGKNYYKLAFSDNGIGLSVADTQRIFNPFVRLNGRSEYPGNGIGLTICKKIIDNHHGIIYAEPNDNAGARFLLILPTKP